MRCCLCTHVDLPNGANGRHYLCCAPLYGDYFSWLKYYKTVTQTTHSSDASDSSSVYKDTASVVSSSDSSKASVKLSRHQTQGVCSNCAGASCQALPSYRRYRLLDRGELTQGEISLLKGQKANGFQPRNGCYSHSSTSPSPPASVRSSAASSPATVPRKKDTRSKSTPHRGPIAPLLRPAPVDNTKRQRHQPEQSSPEPVLSRVEPPTTTRLPHLYWKFVSRVSVHKSLLHRAATRARSRTLTPMAGLTGEGVRLWREFYRRCTAGEEEGEQHDDNEEEEEKASRMQEEAGDVEEERGAAYDGRQTRQRIAALQDKLLSLEPPGPPPVTPASRLSRFTSRQTGRSLTPHVASCHQLWPDTSRRSSLSPTPSYHLSPADVRSASATSLADTACLQYE